MHHHAFRFAGELTDGDGTQYLRARIYDPGTTRFLTKDHAERQNLYHFADANPIVKVDPSGREPQVDFGLAMAGLAFGVGTVLATPFTGGSTLALFGAVATGTFEVGVAAGTAVDRYAVDILPDDWAFGLAITAAVVGFIGAVVSLATVLGHMLATRAARRIGTNLYEGVPIVHDAPPSPPRPSSSPHTPRSTLFDEPPPRMTTADLDRPQGAFPHPLRRTPTDEQIAMPSLQPAVPAPQIPEPIASVSVPSAVRPRSQSAPQLSRRAEPVAATSPGARQATIEEPVYVAPPSSADAVPIEHPLLPSPEIVPRPRVPSNSGQPPAGDPLPAAEQPGFFSGVADWLRSAFASSGAPAPLTGSPSSQALYNRYNLY